MKPEDYKPIAIAADGSYRFYKPGGGLSEWRSPPIMPRGPLPNDSRIQLIEWPLFKPVPLDGAIQSIGWLEPAES